MQNLNLENSVQPCSKRVKAVGGSILHCKHWVPMKFEIEGHSTTQPLYFNDNISQIYFSKQGCIDTKILPQCFPHPSTNLENDSSVISTIKTDSTKSDMPVRSYIPPEKPSQLPFAPIPENVTLLETYIMEKFEQTGFNADAPFPSLSTPPAHIHIKPDAIPYARHVPIPVPHHWKNEIKAGLDRDVERGIIARVPIWNTS